MLSLMLLVLLNLGNMVKGQYEKSRAFSTLTIANNKKKQGKLIHPQKQWILLRDLWVNFKRMVPYKYEERLWNSIEVHLYSVPYKPGFALIIWYSQTPMKQIILLFLKKKK